MKRRLILVLVLLAVAAVATVSVVKSRAKKTLRVDTVMVEPADLTREISANGEIGSKRHASVVATAAGTVSEVTVAVGDRVGVGAVMARLDPASLEANHRSAQMALENARMTVRAEILTLRAAYTQALAAAEQAKRDLDRTQELHKIGSASDEELQRAKDSYAVASESLLSARQKLNFREGRSLDDLQSTPPRADADIVESSTEVKQAKANLESIERSLGETVIRAPIAGIITGLSIELGGFVTLGSPVAEIHDTGILEITANIDEVDLPYVRIGQQARVESDSFIGSVLDAEVSRIAPIIRRIGDTRVCEIKVDILSDVQGVARVGASCSIFITVEDKKGVPAIPVESYLLKDGKKLAFKVGLSASDGVLTVARTEIETGIMGVDKVEVVSGLALGDEIVKSNLNALEDGMEVERASPQGGKEGGGGRT